MQTAALLLAVAVGVLRLAEGSPLPPVAAAAAVSSPDPAKQAPPAAALSQLLPENRRQPPASSSSRPAAEASSTLRKREASPALALTVRLVRRGMAHAQQKREASRDTGASLSINNPLRVLQRRVILEMLRRKFLRKEKQIKENSLILKNLGKRSIRTQPGRHRQRTSDDRLMQQDMKQWLLS